MRLPDIRTIDVRGQRVLVRVDYNVEIVRGQIRDRTRLTATLSTLRWLIQHGARVILVSHRGRPRGAEGNLSLRPLVKPLTGLLLRSVHFSSQPLGSKALRQATERLTNGQVLLLENIRFVPGEEKNSPRTAKQLAALADIFVNDGFAVSHRAAASTVGITQFRPSYAGLLLQKEVATIWKIMRTPRRPYVAIIGGAKISTKLGLVKKLLKQADHILLGGALANTVIRAEGLAIGASLIEPSMVKIARGLTVKNPHLHIPCDVRVTQPNPKPYQFSEVRAVGAIGPGEMVVDIGPDTVALFANVIRKARTVVWNGPMGLYETRPFDQGTKGIAKSIAESRATSVVGGGETIDAIHALHLEKKFTWLSTGGGAMLEFLQGKTLPGIQALLTQERL